MRLDRFTFLEYKILFFDQILNNWPSKIIFFSIFSAFDHMIFVNQAVKLKSLIKLLIEFAISSFVAKLIKNPEHGIKNPEQ